MATLLIKAGAGVITLTIPDLIHDSEQTVVEKFDFVTVRCKENDSVLKIVGHRTQSDPDVETNLFSFFAERHYQ